MLLLIFLYILPISMRFITTSLLQFLVKFVNLCLELWVEGFLGFSEVKTKVYGLERNETSDDPGPTTHKCDL